MKQSTGTLWAQQDRHEGDRKRLFRAVASAVDADRVLYPGSFVDLAPSFVWRHVTYNDSDGRAEGFFGDDQGVREIIANNDPAFAEPEVAFLAGDYSADLDLDDESFDLLISLYAGFVSEHCGRYLRIGGTLLVNPSHGDAAMASIDSRFCLRAVVESRDGSYRVREDELDTFLVPKKPVDLSAEFLHQSGRGIGYTRSPFAYLFVRVG